MYSVSKEYQELCRPHINPRRNTFLKYEKRKKKWQIKPHFHLNSDVLMYCKLKYIHLKQKQCMTSHENGHL